MDKLATGLMFESDEFGDITLRISSDRGSFPVLIAEGWARNDAEKIGNQILAGFDYFIQSKIFPNT